MGNGDLRLICMQLSLFSVCAALYRIVWMCACARVCVLVCMRVCKIVLACSLGRVWPVLHLVPWWETSAIGDLTRLERYDGLGGARNGWGMVGWLRRKDGEVTNWPAGYRRSSWSRECFRWRVSRQTSHLHLWRNLSLSLVLSFLYISPFPFYPRCLLLSGLFFSSSFNLLLSCLLSIIFFAPCPQPVMAQTLNLSIFSSSSSLLPGALCFFFHSLPLFFVSWWLCTHAYTFPTLSSLILSLCLGHVGAVALTHSNWQITFLMEFNYLSLPHGDLARKRPTAAAAVWGRTGQKGKARRGGGRRNRGRERCSFPPVARNWITSVLIWRNVIQREREQEWGMVKEKWRQKDAKKHKFIQREKRMNDRWLVGKTCEYEWIYIHFTAWITLMWTRKTCFYHTGVHDLHRILILNLNTTIITQLPNMSHKH